MPRVLLLLLVVGVTACSSGGGSADALCSAVAKEDGLATAFEGFDPTDPEAALEQLRPARVTLGNLLDDAPTEVRDDLRVEIDYVQGLIDVLTTVSPGDPERTVVKVQEVTDAHPEVGAAAAALAAFAAREC